MGNQPSGYCCSNTAPSPVWLASPLRRVLRCLSKCFFFCNFRDFCFYFVQSCCMDFFPAYFVVCYVFFSRGLIGLSRLARLGMNFMSWCIEPIRERNCFSVLGGFRFIMESVFFTVGEIHDWVIL